MNASLSEKLSAVKWGEFRLTDIFVVKNTSNLLASDIIAGSGETPYLCASSENNAVSSYIKYDKEHLEKGNCIFIGGKTFVVTYQSKDFYSNDSHNLALYLKKGTPSKAAFLYMASCVYKSLHRKYSWGNSISKAKIQEDIITLPVSNGKIDFAFMDSFIAELEAERVAELSAYLAVSGLDNYELTEKEIASIETMILAQVMILVCIGVQITHIPKLRCYFLQLQWKGLCTENILMVKNCAVLKVYILKCRFLQKMENRIIPPWKH